MFELLCFHLAACLYPGGIFDRSAFPLPTPGLGLPANAPGPADRALARLMEERKKRGYRSPIILAGDQIYADATVGLLDPAIGKAPLNEIYDRLYAQRWRNSALRNVDVVALMDDHEVLDNWEPSLHPARDAALSETLRIGRECFLDRQRKVKDIGCLDLWQVMLVEDHVLFVGDTRSERTARDPANIDKARIMSKRQDCAMRNALAEDQKQWPKRHRFVATPSMLLPRRLAVAECPGEPAAALQSDSWCGYPASLHRLLAHLCDKEIERCVFLSGDEHLGCVATARVERLGANGQPDGAAVTLWSVHAGALYAPFPFANSVAEDFPDHEVFEFVVAGRRYRCTVDAWFPGIGDSFVEICLSQGQGQDEALTVTYRDGLDASGKADKAWPPT